MSSCQSLYSNVITTFSVGGLVGVRSRDILQGCMLIDRPNDNVFPELTTGGFLTLQWPGYSSRAAGTSGWARIDISDDEPITRLELAREICGHFSRFKKIASKTKIKPGWEHCALGEHATDIMLYAVFCCGNTLIPYFHFIDQGGIERHINFASNVVIYPRHNRIISAH
ncbi:hypothetical protein SCLCIDRAFT_1211817 [Scleroderma citrinum Foug A]|uniref:Uncharacterized protein n=1 Tax=Scleroderma citrinum Foug A TaxID=1036808 RepID=A0A0C3EBX0_9AGAM|nr:hypothetical protein SCLCIDRAFT_1211817 [Scleroderma citrinum Foug A]